MNFFSQNPYSLLFFSTLFLGIFISVSSNNWIAIWLGLELNIYSFIPILLQSNLNQENEAAINYFLVQAFASAILLLSIINISSSLSPFFLTLSLITNLGLAPCHIWLPIVISALSWNICWILATIQNITPLILLTQTINNISAPIIILISSLSGLIGGMGGLNQTQLRAILAYSSINHLGWIIASTLFSFISTTIYFLSYFIILSSIIINLNFSQTFSSKPSTLNSLQLPFISISLLSLGGLPPLFGFFPNFIIICLLINNSPPIFFLSFILIISSTISLYYYLNIIFNINFLWPNSTLLTSNNTFPLQISIFNSILFTSSIILGLSIFIFII